MSPASAATGSRTTVDPAQSACASVRLATYLGSRLSGPAMGSSGSVTFGQWLAKISYVPRPRRNAPARENTSDMNAPIGASKWGMTHPPWAKPPAVSSVAPPGACMTPSRETKVVMERMPIDP